MGVATSNRFDASLNADLATGVIPDSSGNDRDGTLFAPGNSELVDSVDADHGRALRLPGGANTSTTSSYVTLPKGVFEDVTQTTISTWVNWDGGDAFQWVYGLGRDANNSAFYPPPDSPMTARPAPV